MLPQVYLDRMSTAVHARRWRSRLMRSGEVTLVAETAQGLAGYCSGDWTRSGARPGEAEITTLYVLRRAHGAGIGRRLLTQTAQALAARGARALKIWVLRDNAGARRFYEAMGGGCDRERDEPVGGGIVASVAYRWSDIRRLCSARATARGAVMLKRSGAGCARCALAVRAWLCHGCGHAVRPRRCRASGHPAPRGRRRRSRPQPARCWSRSLARAGSGWAADRDLLKREAAGRGRATRGEARSDRPPRACASVTDVASISPRRTSARLHPGDASPLLQ